MNFATTQSCDNNPICDKYSIVLFRRGFDLNGYVYKSLAGLVRSRITAITT